ncbi:hypothetical protein PR048_030832 [Dryococelus australis]|uniref:Uncharacterized protein n=1 Tax=Dryococelus australis TaxID=614101 RepID=A0ABQ9GA01_9NEOP|nr:hypothetical protein PR048_030832 [Dryococelus australis]
MDYTADLEGLLLKLRQDLPQEHIRRVYASMADRIAAYIQANVASQLSEDAVSTHSRKQGGGNFNQYSRELGEEINEKNKTARKTSEKSYVGLYFLYPKIVGYFFVCHVQESRRKRLQLLKEIYQSHVPAMKFDSALIAKGIAVAERLARSPPTEANRAQYPAGSQDFRKWESCRTMPFVGGFSRGSPASPAPSFQRRSIFASINLIDSQDLAVKGRSNLFTLFTYCNGHSDSALRPDLPSF